MFKYLNAMCYSKEQPLELMALEYLSVDGSSISNIGFSYLPFDMIKSIKELRMSPAQLDQSFFERLVPRMPLLRILAVSPDRDQYPHLDLEWIPDITNLTQLTTLILDGIAYNLDILNYFDKNLSFVRESAGVKKEREGEREALEEQWAAEKDQKLKKHDRKEQSKKRGEDKSAQDLDEKIRVAKDQIDALRKKGGDIESDPRLIELTQQHLKLIGEREKYEARMAENRAKRLAELKKELEGDEAAHNEVRETWAEEDAQEAANQATSQLLLRSSDGGGTMGHSTYHLDSLTLNGVAPEELAQLTVLGEALKVLMLLEVGEPARAYCEVIEKAFPALEYLGVCRVMDTTDHSVSKEWVESLRAMEASASSPSLSRRFHLCCKTTTSFAGVTLSLPLTWEGGRCELECPNCRGGEQQQQTVSSTFTFIGDNIIQIAREDLFNDVIESEYTTSQNADVIWCGCAQCRAQLQRWQRRADGRDDQDDSDDGEEIDGGKGSRQNQFERHGHKIKNRDIMYGHKIITKKER